MNALFHLKADLAALGSPEKAANSARFFKTGPGQYGEGDQFLGVTLPEQHAVAKRYRDLPLTDLEALLLSPIHEERLTSLLILRDQFKRGDTTTQKAIYDSYLAHANRVNNWDLVDSSAEYIVGPWLQDKDKSVLRDLARSESVWERRIAMISTFHYIWEGDPTDALEIAEILLHDKHDLIQKAVGWMLREIGKRCSVETEEKFLRRHCKTMPRTTLRYAIERFSPEKRRAYMEGKI